MRMNRRRNGFALFFAAMCFFALPILGLASDAWIVCFATEQIDYGNPGSETIGWRDKQFFFNSNPATAKIRVLDISNVPLSPIVGDISVPANGLASLTGSSSFPEQPCVGDSVCPFIVFAAHLDVPDGVFLSSRAEVLASGGGSCPPIAAPRVLAGLALPVRRVLTPAGVTQYHLGIDAGSDETGAYDGSYAASARTSIGIYNQAAVTANATIEIRRGCDDVAIERRAVLVPPNSLVQYGGLAWDTSGCGLTSKTPRYALYAVVTVDRPSFSYAISLRKDVPPELVGIAPVTQ